MTIRRVMPFIPRLELFLIGSILLIFFCAGLENVPFHPDESGWIGASYYLEAFISGQFASPVWQESHLTLAQPPVVLYIVGLGRLAGGYHVTDLNNASFNVQVDWATNVAQGAVPDAGLLWWSRLPMAILAALSGLLLFQSIRRGAGRGAGYIWLLMFAASSYLSITLRQAMSEAPLLAIVALFILVGEQALRSWQHAAEAYPSSPTLLRPLAWFILLGVLSGLASAIKLNGMIIAAAGVAMCGLAALVFRGQAPRSARLTLLIRASVLLVLVTELTFVVVNPYLYPDPLGRTGKMFKLRLQEMQFQQMVFPESSIDGWAERIDLVPRRVLEDYAVLHFPGALLINLALGVGGLCYLMIHAGRWVKTKQGPNSAVVILLAAGTMAVPPLLTPLDWPRYYLMPVVFSTLCIAVGIARGLLSAARYTHVWRTSWPRPSC
jgi:hypothetical protein